MVQDVPLTAIAAEIGKYRQLVPDSGKVGALIEHAHSKELEVVDHL